MKGPQVVELGVPEGLKTFEEVEAYVQQELGVDYVYTDDDVPADVDCEEIFEIKASR